MKLVARPGTAFLEYQGFFKEPFFDLSKEEIRISIIKKLMKAFDLRLNDFKFDADSPSNNLVRFIKFYPNLTLEAFGGYEEVLARLKEPRNVDQAQDIFLKLFEIWDSFFSFSGHRMLIQRHLSSEEDINLFLESLNPYYPDGFKKFLTGRGVYYTLQLSQHNLLIYITLVNSLLIQGGVFLSLDYTFTSSNYSAKEAFNIAKKQYDLILNALNITIEELK